jgi:hypothetical protein
MASEESTAPFYEPMERAPEKADVSVTEGPWE